MMQHTDDKEIEVRFLDINVVALNEVLQASGAVDKGADQFHEVIFYDSAGKWVDEERKFVRLRTTKKGSTLTFKRNLTVTSEGTQEIEFAVDNPMKATRFLEALDLVAFRVQEKRRHTWHYGDVVVDIDTWPKVPTYVELEGPSEEALKKTAAALGLDWSLVVLEPPRYIIEKRYGIPVSRLHKFTFQEVS